jgi:hypothetical protein
MQKVVHRCTAVDLSIGGNMATMFTKDDAQTCCGCDSKDPSFRLISLQLAPNNARSLVPECTATLLCSDCLKRKRGFLAVCTEEGMCECDVQVVSMIFSSGHDWSHQA